MALTPAGGAAVGTALPAATIKAIGCQRIQFDITGTYVNPGGHAAWTTFVRTILGTRITPVAMIDALPGGAYKLYWDKTNDALRIFVASTGVEVANGVAVTITNGEMDVLYQ
jgi:hypothetical protein